jgi:hypothetical protein
MCTMRQPKMPDPPAPPEIVPPTQMAAPQTPEAASRTAGSQQRNRMRSAAPTILTSGSGALSTAPTDKKTLLGA